ncbi:hypothetical protein EJB05_07924, partial [Eragrostis curvula]
MDRGLRPPAGRRSLCPSIGDPMAAAAMPPPPPRPPMKVTKAGCGGKAASTASRGGKGIASTSTRGGKGTASKPSIPFLPTPAARASPAMVSPVRQALSCLKAMDSQRLPPNLTDDLLREIFLRASPADLVRASAACASFCRLIADPYFLRRYRSLHPPMLLGFINYDGLHPLQAPHPNAPAACAFARTVDFSFGYIPRNRDAEIMDVRNGCILVDLGDGSGDVAVCDPMSRRCQLVPPLPDDVLASAQIQEDDIIYFVTCVLPSEDIEETAFRLIRGMNLKTGIAISVFSSRSGRWSVTTSINYNALGLDATKVPRGYLLDYRFYYVYGCFYWRLSECDKLLKLDMKTMMLSTHDLPPGHEERSVAFGEAGDVRKVVMEDTRPQNKARKGGTSKRGSQDAPDATAMSSQSNMNTTHIKKKKQACAKIRQSPMPKAAEKTKKTSGLGSHPVLLGVTSYLVLSKVYKVLPLLALLFFGKKMLSGVVMMTSDAKYFQGRKPEQGLLILCTSWYPHLEFQKLPKFLSLGYLFSIYTTTSSVGRM